MNNARSSFWVCDQADHDDLQKACLTLLIFKFVSDELAKPFDGKTVVVTHHPPTYEIRRQWSSADMDAWNQLPFVPWGADRHGYQSFSELLGGYGSPLEQAFFRKGWPILQENGYVEGTGELMGADLWIHGHTHESYEYALAGTRFVVNAQDVPVRRFADNLVSLDDGLEDAQWLALKRLERKLNEVIEKLKPWLECPQLEQITHPLIEDTILHELDEYMHEAFEALRDFEAALVRAASAGGIRECDGLFSIDRNSVNFVQSLLPGDTRDPSLLTRKHIKIVIAELEQEKAALLTGGRWKPALKRLAGS